MKKFGLHKTRLAHAAKRVLCLFLAVLSLAGDGALLRVSAAETGMSERTFYEWKRVKKREDLPRDPYWHPVIIGYLAGGKLHYLDERGYVDNLSFTPDVYTEEWPSVCAAGSLAPLNDDKSFITLDDPLTDLAILRVNKDYDDNEETNNNFIIGRNIDYNEQFNTKSGKFTIKTSYDGKNLTFNSLDEYAKWINSLPKAGTASGIVGQGGGGTSYYSSTDDTSFWSERFKRSMQLAKQFLRSDSKNEAYFASAQYYQNSHYSNNGGNGGVRWNFVTTDTPGTGYGTKRSNLPDGKLRIVYVWPGIQEDLTLQYQVDRPSYAKVDDRNVYDYQYGDFYVWVGTQYKMNEMRGTKDSTTGGYTHSIQSGNVLNVRDDTYIPEGTTVIVEPGAVMLIDGATLYNNGTILNYGTIVLQNNSAITRLEIASARGGNLYCEGSLGERYNGMVPEGNLLVLDSGSRIVFPDGEDRFRVANGATVGLNGLMICPNAFKLADSDFYIRKAGTLICQYGIAKKYVMPRDYTLTDAGTEKVSVVPSVLSTSNSSSVTSMYVSGAYQLINDGVFKNAGDAIIEIGTKSFTTTAITEVAGTGKYTAMVDRSKEGWTKTFDTGDIEKIVTYPGGGTITYYRDGTTITTNPDGSSYEKCYNATTYTHICRDADGWYQMAGSGVSLWDGSPTTTGDYWKDIEYGYKVGNYWSSRWEYRHEQSGGISRDVLTSEGYYDPKLDRFITIYYDENRVTMERRDGRIEVYEGASYKELASLDYRRVLKDVGFFVGILDRYVTASGQTVEAQSQDASYSGYDRTGKLTFFPQDTQDVILTYKDHTEEFITFGTYEDPSRRRTLTLNDDMDMRKTLPVYLEYTSGKYQGKKITYTTIGKGIEEGPGGDRELGANYFKELIPEYFNTFTDYSILWTVDDGTSIFVCRCKWNAEKESYDYFVGGRPRDGYVAGREQYYTDNNMWIESKEISGGKTPYAEDFLMGWPY